MIRCRPAVRGATIIEVVMAIIILSIALPPLVSAFADAAMQSIHPANATVAGFLAIERMEEIVATRYSGSGGYSGVCSEASAAASVSGFSGFTREVTVSYTDSDLQAAGSDQGYTKVRVTVAWNGGSDEIVIERIFTDY